MKIITVSREFGSGGRELGKRIAEALGFDYYDKEIISSIAQTQGLDESYVEKALENYAANGSQPVYHRSFGLPRQSPQIGLLLAQKKVIEGIARRGRDCVVVGRNADVYLAAEKPFNLFVCADMEAKIARCVARAPKGENLSKKQIARKINEINKGRAKTREIIANTKWGDPKTYHLTVNTSGFELEELVPAIVEFANSFFKSGQ